MGYSYVVAAICISIIFAVIVVIAVMDKKFGPTEKKVDELESRFSRIESELAAVKGRTHAILSCLLGQKGKDPEN